MFPWKQLSKRPRHPGPNASYLLLKSIWLSLSSCWQHANSRPGSTRTARSREASLCWGFQNSAMRHGRTFMVNVILRLGHVPPQTRPLPLEVPKIRHLRDEETEPGQQSSPQGQLFRKPLSQTRPQVAFSKWQPSLQTDRLATQRDKDRDFETVHWHRGGECARLTDFLLLVIFHFLKPGHLARLHDKDECQHTCTHPCTLTKF